MFVCVQHFDRDARACVSNRSNMQFTTYSMTSRKLNIDSNAIRADEKRSGYSEPHTLSAETVWCGRPQQQQHTVSTHMLRLRNLTMSHHQLHPCGSHGCLALDVAMQLTSSVEGVYSAMCTPTGYITESPSR